MTGVQTCALPIWLIFLDHIPSNAVSWITIRNYGFSDATVFPESNLVIDGVLLNPTRSALLDVLTAMGSRISMVRVEEQHGELLGTITLVPGVAKPVTIAGAQTALLIDELPVLAAIAPYTAGLEVRDAGELRVKESDRLSAVTQNLRAMGAQVEQTDDGWRIPGGQRLHSAEIESFGDHRIAMAFAIAALRAQGETIIRNSECEIGRAHV